MVAMIKLNFFEQSHFIPILAASVSVCRDDDSAVGKSGGGSSGGGGGGGGWLEYASRTIGLLSLFMYKVVY